MEDHLSEQIDAIELLASDNVDEARKHLRLFLFAQGQHGETGTIGDALRILAERHTEYRQLAPVILRFLAVPGLIPENNPSNQIARSLVSLATGSLPELCDFLGASAAQQSFEAYNILKGAHDRICAYLAPLQKDTTTVELLLTARHPVIECLNHFAVKAYCAPFGLPSATSCIEQVFSLIRKISTSEPAALQHQIRLLKDLVEKYNATLARRSNFFVQDYFLSFLNAAEHSVENFLAQTRARFAAPIVARLAPDHSIAKRYPLEQERQFILHIPLRNSGPGTALNVQAQITHDEYVVFGTHSVNIGTYIRA